MKEIELKFLVPENKLTAIRRQTHIKSSKFNHLTAHYFDTPEQDLAKHGMAIRIRQETDEHKNDWVQTIKAKSDGLASRLEHNYKLDPEQAKANHKNNSLMPDFDVYADTEIANIFLSLKKSGKFNLASAIKKINCLYSTDVKRTMRLVKKAGSVIEIAYDIGEVIHGTDNAQRQPLHEVEFEVITGNTDFLFETAKTWCQRYNLCLSTITKAERGSLVLAGQTHPEAVKADLKALQISPNASKAEFMRAVVHNCLLQILPNASAIVAGSVPHSSLKHTNHGSNYGSEHGTNHVHQVRVGIRRLRTALKFFDGFSEQVNPKWSNVLKNTFAQLGEYRDRDVLQHKTQPMLETVGSPHVEWVMDENITVKPITAVSNSDFQLILLELIEFAMSEVNCDTQSHNANVDNTQANKAESKDTLKPAKTATSKILTKLFDKIAVASDHFAELEIEAQHDVRKRLKALRYISEFSAPLYKLSKQEKASYDKESKTKDKPEKRKSLVSTDKPVSSGESTTAIKPKAFIKYLEPAQEVLGDYNDNIVGYEFYVQKAISQPNAYFAVGWFLAREKESAKVCAESLKVVGDAPRFW